MAEEKKEASTEKYELVQIPTQTNPDGSGSWSIGFRDTEQANEEEAILEDKELLRRIANDVAEIKKNIA